jgi:hypothetical protein
VSIILRYQVIRLACSLLKLEIVLCYTNRSKGWLFVVERIFVTVPVAQFRQYSTIRLNEVKKRIEAEARAGYLLSTGQNLKVAE